MSDRTARHADGATSARRDALVEASPLPVVVLDETGRVQVWSPAAEALFGWTAAEAVGRPLPCVPPGDAPLRDALHQRVLTGEVLVQVPLEAVDHRGTPLEVSVSASLLSVDDRGPAEILVVLTDETDRNLSARALREHEHTLQNLMANLPGMAYRCEPDPPWRMLYVSAGAESLTGVRSADLMAGRPDFGDLVHPEDLPGILEEIREATAAGRHFVLEYRILTPSGREKWVWEQGRRVERDEGPVLIGFILDVTAQKRAEQRLETTAAALKASEARARALFEHLPVSTVVGQVQGEEVVVVAANAAARERSGPWAAQALGRKASELFAHRPDLLEALDTCRRTGAPVQRILPGLIDAGEAEARTLRVTFGPVPPDLVVAHAEDVTDRLRLEEQLKVTQKMEAVGRLAGGVAHDFNNMLAAINGYAAVVLEEMSPADPLREDLLEIQRAGERAAALTRQLLAFSRRQALHIERFDLNEVVEETERMLRRLIGEHIEMRLELDPTPGFVEADRAQLEQVVTNLVVNARDAMPGGGRLTLATATVVLGEEARRLDPDLAPGPYCRLTLRDSGVGMDEAVLAHVFEPFFTTKPKGEGTGLGLAMAYGIVKQIGGHIDVRSRPGEGTEVVIHLPAAGEDAIFAEPQGVPARAAGGRETVLLVEDEVLVRRFVARALTRLGYEVLEAEDPVEALRRAESFEGEIHLVLTDVVMPRMNGVLLSRRLEADRPGLRVLLMSGYTDDALGLAGADAYELISKPFTPTELATRVRALLDEARPED